MNLKGIEIEIVNGDLSRVKTDVVVASSGVRSQARYCLSEEIDAATPGSIEVTLRRSCAEALLKAHMLRVRSLALGAFGIDARKFPSVAVAKILAQEIYRYARNFGDSGRRLKRSSRRFLKEIRVVGASARETAVFQKTITGYLEHIVTALETGPFVTVDVIIELERGGIVLIKRSNPPFGWALPGGFLDYGETLEEAASREAREETGLAVTGLRQLRTYSDPSRDPRFQTITTVFVARAAGKPRAASDAAQAKVVHAREGRDMELAFDHAQILDDYLRWKRGERRRRPRR